MYNHPENFELNLRPKPVECFYPRSQRRSMNKTVVSNLKMIANRELGIVPHSRHFDEVLRKGQLQNTHILSQKEFNMGGVNKIFSSRWLTSSKVIYGTKCNKLIVQDVNNGERWVVPSLQSHSRLPDCSCGVHSIDINPSKTLLATGAQNVNDIALYRLPTLDPLAVGEGGHTDWVFDMKWLDDEFLASGSRDASVCLWRVTDDLENNCAMNVDSESDEFTPGTLRPVCKRRPKQALPSDKIRAIACDYHWKALAALSLSAKLYLIDLETFKSIHAIELKQKRENVCISFCERRRSYAIGSTSHVTLIDPRQVRKQDAIASEQLGSGVRSVNFKDDIISYGTGLGRLYLYDLRNKKHVACNCGHAGYLSAARGHLRIDPNYHPGEFNYDAYPPAIYTHQYDDTGLRIFMAGGPLAAGLYGNYGAVWY